MPIAEECILNFINRSANNYCDLLRLWKKYILQKIELLFLFYAKLTP